MDIPPISPDQIKDMGIGLAEGAVLGVCLVLFVWILNKVLKVALIVLAVSAIVYFGAPEIPAIKEFLSNTDIDSLLSEVKPVINSASSYVGAGFLATSKATTEMSIPKFFSAIVGIFLGAAMVVGNNKKRKS